MLEVFTTRELPAAASRGRSRLVSRNGARWLTWKFGSWPSWVCFFGENVPPALFISTSSVSTRSPTCSARRRTSSSREKSAISGSVPTASATGRSLSAERPVTCTVAPAAASFRAVSAPIPSLAPVTRTVRPAIVCALMARA